MGISWRETENGIKDESVEKAELYEIIAQMGENIELMQSELNALKGGDENG